MIISASYIFREASDDDLSALKNLALKSWNQFREGLTEENWQKLNAFLNDDETFGELLRIAKGFLCLDENKKAVGMSFLVPSGNPTELFDVTWAYIRMVTVDPTHVGRGIARKLTEQCIEYAKKEGESIIALHTSETMPNARHLYESLGFTILKEIAPRLGNKYWIYTMEIGNDTN